MSAQRDFWELDFWGLTEQDHVDAALADSMRLGDAPTIAVQQPIAAAKGAAR